MITVYGALSVFQEEWRKGISKRNEALRFEIEFLDMRKEKFGDVV